MDNKRYEKVKTFVLREMPKMDLSIHECHLLHHFLNDVGKLIDKPVETTNEQPKIIITQLMIQYVGENGFVKEKKKAKKFNSYEEAKQFRKDNYGRDLEFQYIIG